MSSRLGMYSCGSVVVKSQERGAGALAVDGSGPSAGVQRSKQGRCRYCMMIRRQGSRWQSAGCTIHRRLLDREAPAKRGFGSAGHLK